MEHPLEGAWAKFGRAKQHIEAFQNKATRTLKSYKGQFITVKKQFNDEENSFIFTVNTIKITEKYFTEWGVIIGDALHDLRSCLDHIAWLLVKTGTGGPLNAEQEKKVAFPIYEDGPKFNGALSTYLPGVSEEFIAIVRRYQPYHRGDKSSVHPLAVLQALNNSDKHRIVQTLLFRSLSTQYKIRTDTMENCTFAHAGIPLSNRLEPNAELLRVFVVPTETGKPNVDVEFKGGVNIAFDERAFAKDVLDEIVAAALLVLWEFQPFYQGTIIEATQGG